MALLALSACFETKADEVEGDAAADGDGGSSENTGAGAGGSESGAGGAAAEPRAVVYVTFGMHSEQPRDDSPLTPQDESRPDWREAAVYDANRPLLRDFVAAITDAGATLTFQSDWTYLEAHADREDEADQTDTDGLPMLEWMRARGVGLDPHAHESEYNYADVAYLWSALGIEPSKVVGGFIADDPGSPNGWAQHEDGLYGWQYPDYFWRADVLFGAGSENHENDPSRAGIWRPASESDFFTHDADQRLINVGPCSSSYAGIEALLADLDSGAASSDGFHTATMMYAQDYLTADTPAEVTGIIEALAPRVASGQVRWATVAEMAELWLEAGEPVTQYQCLPWGS